VRHYTGAHTVIFRGIFSIYYSPDGTSEAEWAERGWGAWDIIFLRVPNSLEGCDGWGEGRGILYLTSVVQWKDIRPWGPSSGLKEAFVSGNGKFIFFADEFEAAKLRWAEGTQRPFGV
jgi:hypothetical protein